MKLDITDYQYHIIKSEGELKRPEQSHLSSWAILELNKIFKT